MEPAPQSETEPQIAATVAREQGKLKNFIRKWVVDEADVEDVLQDVFYELVEAYRLVTPLEHASAWLYRVARNRITDLFRRRRAESLRRAEPEPADEPAPSLEDWLPSADAGPDALFTRRVLLEALQAGIEELPPGQREVFVAHEMEGVSFQALAERTGLPINTLLSRKHYAVLRLRRRLKAFYEEDSHVPS